MRYWEILPLLFLPFPDLGPSCSLSCCNSRPSRCRQFALLLASVCRCLLPCPLGCATFQQVQYLIQFGDLCSDLFGNRLQTHVFPSFRWMRSGQDSMRIGIDDTFATASPSCIQ